MSKNKSSNKALASRAESTLKELGYEVKHTHCLELVSRLAGFRSWNAANGNDADLAAKLAPALKPHSGAGKLEQVGEYLYYFDGSAGEIYAKTDQETLMAFIEKNDGSPAPFECAIPGNGDEVHFYRAGKEFPHSTMSLDDYNREFGTGFTSIREMLGGRETTMDLRLAEGLLVKLEEFGRQGLPACYKDSMSNYLFDMWPDLPWDKSGQKRAVEFILADARFPAVRQSFLDRYSFDLQAELENGLASNLI